MEPEDDFQNGDDVQDGDDQEGMHPMRKVLRINLIILLIYAGVFLMSAFLFASGEEMGAVLVWTGLAMLVHGVLNLVVGVLLFIMRKSGEGKGALVSGLVLLIIGFSSCVAALSTMSFH